ncbi:MAG: alpha/beta hydrolase [Terracidiphilus sp.]
MTTFLDVRARWGGGDLGHDVLVMTGTNAVDYAALPLSDLKSFIHGKDVLIGTHGFNVNRKDGIEHLSYWEGLLQLPACGVFVGLLWPGDSESLHALSYPSEPKNATAAGDMIAKFVDENFGDAASISFVSHSLGARVVLQTISQMSLPVRRAIVMAGAIGDDCLTAEFASVPAKVEVISVLASQEDEVLRWAFPLGDFAAEILGHKHPWWESALGRFGPRARPQNYQAPCQIPKEWNYGHGNYLQDDPKATAPIPSDTVVPQSGSCPQGGADGWQEAWSASFVSTRFN